MQPTTRPSISASCSRGVVLLEIRYYALDGYATVTDIAPLVEHFIAGNEEINFVEVRLEASDGDEKPN